MWITQEQMALLFQRDKSTISRHIRNIFDEGELEESLVVAKNATPKKYGRREGFLQEAELTYYNLDVIISVGYRVKSQRGVQFRQWCTAVLRQFAIRGYIIDRKRMENGAFISEDYFEYLLAEIREIRLSERRFYQKITDIYATAIDYNPNAPTTQEFFAKVHNKMHYAAY